MTISRKNPKGHSVHFTSIYIRLIGEYLTLEDLAKSLILNSSYLKEVKFLCEFPSDKHVIIHNAKFKTKLKETLLNNFTSNDGCGPIYEDIVRELRNNQFRKEYKEINETAHSPMLFVTVVAGFLLTAIFLCADMLTKERINLGQLSPFILMILLGAFSERHLVNKTNHVINRYNLFVRPLPIARHSFNPVNMPNIRFNQSN